MRTKNQALLSAIVAFINTTYFTTNVVPTIYEIAEKFNISVASVSRYVAHLKEQGVLTSSSAKRSLETRAIRMAKQKAEVPVLGSISCGTPLLGEENIECYLSLSYALLGDGSFFALRANGDSMKNAGIEDGDIVVVRRQEDARDGQIIVALCEGTDCTLKRYYWDKRRKKVRLHPENDDMEDMFFDSIQIQGVAVKVIKDVK